jgi:hypothetical protein
VEVNRNLPNRGNNASANHSRSNISSDNSNEEDQLQHYRTHPFEPHNHPPAMLTKYLTSVTTAFSPFNPKSGKTARNFLALLPPTAHKTMTIDVKVLSQAQKIVPATLALKFSTFERMVSHNVSRKEGSL